MGGGEEGERGDEEYLGGWRGKGGCSRLGEGRGEGLVARWLIVLLGYCP